MSTLLRSQMRAGCCGEVLASIYRHDFQKCRCGAGTFIDGGRDYLRAGGQFGEDLSVRVEEDLNNQDARIVLQALKDINSGVELHAPGWAVDLLERNGLIVHRPGAAGGGWRYVGPELADRDV